MESKCLTRRDYMLQALYDAKILLSIREMLRDCFTTDKK